MKEIAFLDIYIKSTWSFIHRMHHTLAKRHGVSQTVAYILVAVPKAGLKVTDLAFKLNVGDKSLTRTLISMEEMKLIVKVNDEFDKRLVIIKLTELGVQQRKIVVGVLKDYNSLLHKNLTKIEIDTIKSIHDKVAILTKKFIQEIDKK